VSAHIPPTEADQANRLASISVLVIVGEDAGTLTAAAMAAARATTPSRRVAIFDLAGAVDADEASGLVAALRDGRSLNSLARPVGGSGREWFVVGRGPTPADEHIASHPRWAKLVAGFRSQGALLILLLPRDLRGGESLMALADRAVNLPAEWATPDDAPAPRGSESVSGWGAADDLPLPPIAVTPPQGAPPAPSRPRASRRTTLLGVIALVLLVSYGWFGRSRGESAGAPLGNATADSAARTAIIQRSGASPPAVVPETIPLPEIANPEDAARAAAWGIVLVATNDRRDANLRLESAGAALPAGSVAPVFVGGDLTQLYRVVGGAFVDRAEAERLRLVLRGLGILSSQEGTVERLPYAVRLDSAGPAAEARARARWWTARGIAAYSLLDEDGSATVYTGAFASPDQAALLLAALRDEAGSAVLAFRVGRTY
jgi:hypothetical protein